MLPFKTIITIDPESTISVYRQIADSIERNIRNGVLQPGAMLPGSRKLAAMLGISRNTVVSAYDGLVAEGWLVTVERKAVMVGERMPEPRNRSKASPNDVCPPLHAPFIFEPVKSNFVTRPARPDRDSLVLNDGFPDIDLAPTDLFLREFGRLRNSRVIRNEMSVRDAGGVPALKAMTCNFLNQNRGLHIREEGLVLTRGAQMAIFIASAILLRPGDQVIVTDPNYQIADEVFKQRGARLLKVPVDGDGVSVDHVEQALKTKPVRLMYLVTHHHHPTTVTLSEARRQQLLRLIREYSIPVIEDDYDYDFHYDNRQVLPLASGEHDGNIIYIGSYTKLLGPPYRIGYMAAGENFISSAINFKRLMDLRGDTYMEEALANIIANGDLDRHIRRSLKVYRERCIHMCSELEEKLGHAVSFQPPPGGMAVWARFHERMPLEKVIQKAAKKNVYMHGSAYYLGNDARHNGIRLGFASLTFAEISRAIDRLQSVVYEIDRNF